MRPLTYLTPKIQLHEHANGRTEGWCRGCGTLAVLIGKGSVQGFEDRHRKCREEER